MTIGLEFVEDGAVFRYPPEYDPYDRELDDLLDENDSGGLSARRYLDGLRDLAARCPWFIDVHAHIGLALFEQGKTRRALAACMQGVEIGEAAIPSDYDGVIEWGWLENRPFLRAAHGAVLCHLRLRQWRKALPLMEKMLAWNPGDNQGVRYLIGSAYLRAGRLDDARAFLAAEDNDYPPSRYELALLLLGEGSFEAAATALRLGFVENGYIAEMLCGMLHPLPMAIWHGTNFAEPELAREYVLQYGDLWHRTPGAVVFLRWLHTHPAVMAERAAIMECWESLLWEHDVERRGAILDRQQALVNGIDDRLSTEIAVERVDRFGKRVRPWVHLAR